MNIPRLPDSSPADAPTLASADDASPDSQVVTTGQTDFTLPSNGSRRGVPRWAMLVAAVAVAGLVGVNVLGGGAEVVEENDVVEEPAEDLRALFTEADGGPDTEADLGLETATDSGEQIDTDTEIDADPDSNTAAEADSAPTTDPVPDADAAADGPPTTDPVADVTPTTDPASSDQVVTDAPPTTDVVADA